MKNRHLKSIQAGILLLAGFLGIISCGNTKEKTENTGYSNIIELSDAISDLKTVKLSEIADSISYIPLSNDIMIGNRVLFNASDKYLYAGASVFDWDGNYLFEIGSRGRGPGEALYIGNVIDIDTAFYSVADKMIAYNDKGVFAKRERNVLDYHFLHMGRAGTNFATCKMDSIFFFSPELNLINAKRVAPDWAEETTVMNISGYLRFFAHNLDSTLFYNYVNDTIYRVFDNHIEPRWVINLKDDKIPLKHLLGDEWTRLETGGKYFTNNALESWDYIIETDNKVRIFSIYESPNCVFINWFFMAEYWSLRDLPAQQFQIAYFDKQKQTTIAVGRDGFIDDISSLGTFYPMSGVHGNCLLTSKWPHELMDKVEELQQQGLPVDEKLLDVLDRITEESNPVMVMVHLK